MQIPASALTEHQSFHLLYKLVLFYSIIPLVYDLQASRMPVWWLYQNIDVMLCNTNIRLSQCHLSELPIDMTVNRHGATNGCVS